MYSTYYHREAKIICEQDVQCGGFTFKGPKMLDRFVPTRLDMYETLPELKAIQHLFFPLPGKSPAITEMDLLQVIQGTLSSKKGKPFLNISHKTIVLLKVWKILQPNFPLILSEVVSKVWKCPYYFLVPDSCCLQTFLTFPGEFGDKGEAEIIFYT